jgi:D-alanyl-D-alanine carboxypeptidase
VTYCRQFFDATEVLDGPTLASRGDGGCHGRPAPAGGLLKRGTRGLAIGLTICLGGRVCVRVGLYGGRRPARRGHQEPAAGRVRADVRRRHRRRRGDTGAVAYVSVGDQVWTSALGVSDVATQTPIDPAGHGRIGSITKPIVATAVLRLVDQGSLSLDDTVRQLLSMSSGVWNYTTDQSLLDTFEADPMAAWTVDRTIDLIRAQPAAFEPGSKVAYCDSNYVLLGRIAELVTGKPISEVVRTLVTEPLGLTGTRMPADDEPGVPDPSLGSYLPVNGQLVAEPDLNPDFAWTAGAATSTVGDLARFARELTDGSLLSPQLQAQRLQTAQFTGIDLNVGYGLGLLNMNDLIGHNGDINGGGGTMLRLPEQDATFVVLVNLSTNSENASGAIANELIDQLYPGQSVHR